MLFVVLICAIAGICAGIGTGFAGLSAAVFISPMLVAFLKVPAYHAVGISLASDVLASGISAFTYYKNKNIDIKNGLYLLAAVLLFTQVGSYVATLVPDVAMGNLNIVAMALLGVRFLVFPMRSGHAQTDGEHRRAYLIKSVIGGIYIGFVCGFMGTGGGMMMLFVLTVMLGYDLKTAVGTSVFVMTFTALTGAGAHFFHGGMPEMTILCLCVIFTLVGAQVSAKIANRVSVKAMNLITGLVLTIAGIGMLIINNMG